MGHRPIKADIYDTHMDDGLPQDFVVERSFDISEILLAVIKSPDDAVSFAEDRAEFPEFGEELCEHPHIHSVTAFLDPAFDLAAALDPSLTRQSTDEEIQSAWIAWHAEALNACGTTAWADTKWRDRASTFKRWMQEDSPSPAALTDFAKELLRHSRMRDAILDAAGQPEGNTLDGMRTCAAIDAAITLAA